MHGDAYINLLDVLDKIPSLILHLKSRENVV